MYLKCISVGILSFNDLNPFISNSYILLSLNCGELKLGSISSSLIGDK